ncbi:hypothetical protein BH09SUM1_BH09SUM1_32330 [soil metagenome]
MGPSARAAVPALMTALAQKDGRTRRTAAKVLGGIGEPSVAPLRDALGKTDNAGLLLGVIEALGEVGAPAKKAIPDLQKSLSDSDARMRAAAVIALGKIGRTGPPSGGFSASIPLEGEATVEFARFFGGEGNVQTTQPRPSAFRQFIRQSGVPDSQIPPLMNEPQPESKLVISVGGSKGAGVPELATDLSNVLNNDQNPAVRAAAAEGLGYLAPGDAATIEQLTRALTDQAPVPVAAAWALGEIGPQAKEALPQLGVLRGPLNEASRQIVRDAIIKISGQK